MAEAEIYEVEKIMGKGRDAEGTLVYMVQWKGYPAEEATWEPVANLDSCVQMIKVYEEKLVT